ncbi:hypothetical protein FAY30_21295 [Bacillus sp. S3]|uniref:hypothetical protein n=1 Tax=Bacillus sp. S3 TaxID=486398 RepID=UPI00118A49BF|nr:hypothetical protein [Bacillus sp. S3]QCJ44237.1 hypothetical protein FAY30_21295 [Bacillus sp. S3]
MPKTKDVTTPFIFLKKGARHRQQVRPFWKMKRAILGIPLVIILILGFAGYRIGMNLASEKVVKELATQIPEKDIQDLLEDPTVQKEIEDEVGSEKKEEILTKYAVVSATPAKPKESTVPATKEASQTTPVESKVSTPAPVKNKPGLNFKSREDVLKFLLSKFTMGELKDLAKKADGGITPEEKSEIKGVVLQRLSPEEYNAVKVFAIIELGNQSQ